MAKLSPTFFGTSLSLTPVPRNACFDQRQQRGAPSSLVPLLQAYFLPGVILDTDRCVPQAAQTPTATDSQTCMCPYQRPCISCLETALSRVSRCCLLLQLRQLRSRSEPFAAGHRQGPHRRREWFESETVLSLSGCSGHPNDTQVSRVTVTLQACDNCPMVYNPLQANSVPGSSFGDK